MLALSIEKLNAHPGKAVERLVLQFTGRPALTAGTPRNTGTAAKRSPDPDLPSVRQRSGESDERIRIQIQKRRITAAPFRIFRLPPEACFPAGPGGIPALES